VVLPDSDGIPRAPSYSGQHPGRTTGFAYRALTHSGGRLPRPSTTQSSFSLPEGSTAPPTPPSHNPTTTKHVSSLPPRGQPGPPNNTIPQPRNDNARTLSPSLRFRLTPLRSPLLRGSQL